MSDPTDRLHVKTGELGEAVEVSRLRVSLNDANVPLPPAPLPITPKAANRTLLIVLPVIALVGALGMIAVAAWMLAPGQPSESAASSIREPSAAESALIAKGELPLVAPSVEARGGAFGLSTWGGTAVPWRLSSDNRLVLVSNRHVVASDGRAPPDELEILFRGGQRRPALSLAIAETRPVDLALIVVDATGLLEGEHFRLARHATNDDWTLLDEGDEVVAVGSASGYEQTQTFGRISALRDGLDFRDSTVRWIQIDCTVLPGNSGGPLLRATEAGWQWIGVVTLRGEPGIGFAIYVGELWETRYRWIAGSPVFLD